MKSFLIFVVTISFSATVSAASNSKLCSNSISKNLFYSELGFTEAGFTFKPTYNKLIKDFASRCQQDLNDDELIKTTFQSCIDSCKERATAHGNDLTVVGKVFTDKKKEFEKVLSQCQPLCDGIRIGLNAFKAGVSSTHEDCQNTSKDTISNLSRSVKKVEPAPTNKAPNDSSASVEK